MPDTELIAETNRLLQRVLDLSEQRKSDSERGMVDFKAQMEAMKTKREEAMKTRLEEREVPTEVASADEEEIESRRKAALHRSQENIATMQARDREYKERLLAELSTQSDLLRRIAERLEA